jgi:hypothetical protein
MYCIALIHSCLPSCFRLFGSRLLSTGDIDLRIDLEVHTRRHVTASLRHAATMEGKPRVGLLLIFALCILIVAL